MEVIIDGIVYVPKENKSEIEYPIFKRSTNDVVIMLENDEVEYVDCVLTKHSKYIGYRWSKSNFNFSNFETIPFDEERGLYHLQPCWIYEENLRFVDFYNVREKRTIEHLTGWNSTFKIEPITPEQLKVMPFVWEMYQQVLKDK